MIFDPACKQVRRVFKPRHLFPIVHLSRVEWQVLVPVFVTLIMWLEASAFNKNAWTALTDKRVSVCCRKTMKVINTL